MDTQTLYAEVTRLIDAGDEAGVRVFVAEHINDFPENVRSEIALFFFEEAVTQHAEGIQAEEDFQKEAPQALDMLASMKRVLEGEVKLRGVRNRLNLPGTE